MFLGRRIEQGFGNLYGTYLNGKLEEKDRVDLRGFLTNKAKPEEEVLSVDDVMERGLEKLT